MFRTYVCQLSFVETLANVDLEVLLVPPPGVELQLEEVDFGVLRVCLVVVVRVFPLPLRAQALDHIFVVVAYVDVTSLKKNQSY